MFKAIGRFIQLLFKLFIRDPITNGNGVVSIDDFSKYLTTLVAVWMIIYEGLNPELQFTDVQFITVASLLAGIIGVKEFFKSRINNNQSKNNED